MKRCCIGRRLQLVLLSLIAFSNFTQAQDAVVSSYFNATDPRDEWTEILVIQDNLDMRNWSLRDNSSGQDNWSTEITFNNTTFWNHMRAGTIIIIWHRQYSSTTLAHPSDVNSTDGYLELFANDPTYFTGGNFGTSPSFNGATLNIAGGGDILQLRNSTLSHVHALAHKTTVGIDFTNLPQPKLDHTQSLASNEAVFVCPGNTILEYGTPPQIGTTYTAKALDPATTFGLPNTCATGILTNSDFWRTTRQPGWNTPTLTASPNGTYTQVSLAWNSCIDPNSTDGTTGYLILRNTTNSFTDPVDGTSYIMGASIGTATVVDNVSTTMYTDLVSLTCGNNLYYKIYAYRYTDDYFHGNSFDFARGRAYNEVNFASATATGPAPPAAPVVTASPNPVCDGNPVTLTATGCNGTVTWNTLATGSPYTLIPAGTTPYTATCTENGCTSPSSSPVLVVVNLPVIPGISISASNNPICSGTSVTFTAGIINGGTSPSYQWKKNGLNVGTNSSSYTDNSLINNDVITCILTSDALCASPATANSNAVTMIVTTTLAPTISISPDNNPVCTGTAVLFTATTNNGGTLPAFQWKKNGTNVGSNSPTYSDNTLVNNDAITCILTSNASCANPLTANSNTVTMIVTSTLTPDITITADNNPVCTGTTVLFTSTINNGGTSPSYQWKKNGLNVGANNSTYSDNTLANNDVITCILTSNASCVNPSSATSNSVIMIVTSALSPSISITADNNPICTGTTVLFSSTIMNGGSSPGYQWKKNGLNVGTNSSTYSDNTLVNNDMISCVLTSNASCVNPSTAASNTVTMTVTSTLAPTISIIPDNNPICTGTPVVFSSTINNGGSLPAYQWKKNGLYVGTNSPTYSDNTLVNNDVISCILTSNASCANPATATSNAVTMTVASTMAATINITPDDNPVCTGTNVVFTSAINNGGNAPGYQWSKNGSVVGTNSSTYSDNTLINNDVISCTLTSNASCASPATATSNSVIMTVITPLTPAISSLNVTGNNQDVCIGNQFPYTIDPPTTGSVYTWSLTGGGNIISPNGTNLILVNWTSAGGPYILSVTETTVEGCTGAPVTLNIFVNAISKPVAIISPDNNPVCIGTTVTYTAIPTNGGTSPQFTWFVNGIQRPNPGPPTFSYVPSDGDQVCAALNSSSPCASPNPVYSAVDTMIVTSTVAPSLSISTPTTSLCFGDNATITASSTNGGTAPVYAWYKNSLLQAGQTNNTFTFTPGNGDAVYAKVTSNLACASPSLAFSATIVFNVNQSLAVNISISQKPALCHADPVIINAVPANQGPTPVYEWYLNNTPVPGQQTAIYSGLLNEGDKLFAKVISSLGCATGNPAISNELVITLPQLLEINRVDTVNETCGQANGSIDITAVGGTGLLHYSISTPPDWVDGHVFDSLSSSIPYNLQVQDANGCIAYMGIYQLKNIPGPAISTSGGGDYCIGDTVQLRVFSPVSLSYEWEYPSGTYLNNDEILIPGVSLSDSGTYKVIAKEISTGCQDEAWLYVRVHELPGVNFGLPSTVCTGTVSLLDPGSGYSSYLWQDSSSAPTYQAFNEGIYYVTVTDLSGCKATDSVTLTNCYNVYFPNAFSPDRDGVNETFRPVTGGIVLLDYSIKVYNRWGQVIYESIDYLGGWDGTLNGSDVLPGLYTYVVDYRLADQSKPGGGSKTILRGSVLLLR